MSDMQAVVQMAQHLRATLNVGKLAGCKELKMPIGALRDLLRVIEELAQECVEKRDGE